MPGAATINVHAQKTVKQHEISVAILRSTDLCIDNYCLYLQFVVILSVIYLFYVDMFLFIEQHITTEVNYGAMRIPFVLYLSFYPHERVILVDETS